MCCSPRPYRAFILTPNSKFESELFIDPPEQHDEDEIDNGAGHGGDDLGRNSISLSFAYVGFKLT